MIIFFGPPGAGKSVQGQMLAARFGWRWLSAGQLLRDTHDPELLLQMQRGELVDSDRVDRIMGEAIRKAHDIDHVILDGFPRELVQAEWLIGSQPEHNRAIQLVIVLEISKADILHRLHVRGRADDVPEVIEERLQIYRQQIYPILNYMNDQKVHITHLDGSGTVGQIHDRICEELTACSLV